MTSTKPQVQLLATGGTIANPPGIDGYLSGEELIDAIPQIKEEAEVEVTEIARIGSSGISPAVWCDLHQAIETAANSRSPPDGFVITHGSNTIEETAYFLNLTLNTELPVVLTAAQRNHGTVGNDGDRNLLDAVRIAGHSDAGGQGVLVAVNDEIHHSRDVTKQVSGRPDAWYSDNFGPIGLTDKYGRVEFYGECSRVHTAETAFDLKDVSAEELPYVSVLYTTAADDGRLVNAARETDVDGIVIAALPTGRAAKPQGGATQLEALEAAAEELPIAVSHRGGQGWPAPRILDGSTFLWADTLSPQKAAILLSLGLTNTSDQDELQEYFLTH